MFLEFHVFLFIGKTKARFLDICSGRRGGMRGPCVPVKGLLHWGLDFFPFQVTLNSGVMKPLVRQQELMWLSLSY